MRGRQKRGEDKGGGKKIKKSRSLNYLHSLTFQLVSSHLPVNCSCLYRLPNRLCHRLYPLSLCESPRSPLVSDLFRVLWPCSPPSVNTSFASDMKFSVQSLFALSRFPGHDTLFPMVLCPIGFLHQHAIRVSY